MRREYRDGLAGLLIAALVTSFLAAASLRSGLYFGSVYGFGDSLRRFGFELLTMPFLVLLVLPFAAAFVWPVAIIGARLCVKYEARDRWWVWIVCGVALGIPAMWLYSMILRLGHELYIAVSLNGAIFGAIAAALCRKLLRSKIDDAVPAEPE